MVKHNKSVDEVETRSDASDQAGQGVHVFTILKRDWNDGNVREDFHEDNIAAARQYLMSQGLRPSEHGHFDGAEDHEDPSSINLRYSFAAVPASDTKAQPKVREDDNKGE